MSFCLSVSSVPCRQVVGSSLTVGPKSFPGEHIFNPTQKQKKRQNLNMHMYNVTHGRYINVTHDTLF